MVFSHVWKIEKIGSLTAFLTQNGSSVKCPELWNGACSHIIPRFYRQQTAYKIWITHKRINWNYNLKETLVGMDDEMTLEFMKARFLF